jgi:hypothetical protein
MTTKYKVVVSTDYTNFKNNTFSGISSVVVGEKEYQNFKYTNKEKEAKNTSSSKLSKVGPGDQQDENKLDIDFSTEERISDEMVRQRAKEKVLVEAQERAERRKREKMMLKEAQITDAAGKGGKNVKKGDGKRPYYFSFGGINLSTIKRFSKKQINDEKYKDADVLGAEIKDIANTYNEAVQQGIVELSGKKDKHGNKKIKILDKERFKKLIKEKNEAKKPETKKATKASAKSKEKEITKNNSKKN